MGVQVAGDVELGAFALSGAVDTSRAGQCPVVVPPDALDLSTTPQVLSDIWRCLAKQPERLIVDMSEVRFLGSAGIQALLQAREQAERAGVRLQLDGVGSNGLVRRMLTIAGVIRLFDITDPAPRPPDVAEGTSAGTKLMFQNQPGRRSDAADVTGGYCEEDTGRLRWVAIQSAGQVGHQDEWLVPARRIVGYGDRFFVALPTNAIWGAPTVSGAPEEIGDEIEDRLWRYYADVVNPTTTRWPTPTSCSAGRCYRIPDVADALAQLTIHRRVVDCRSARLDPPQR